MIVQVRAKVRIGRHRLARQPWPEQGLVAQDTKRQVCLCAHVDPVQALHRGGAQLRERVGGECYRAVLARHNQDVAVVKGDHQVIVKGLCDRLDHRCRALGVGLIHLQPLSEQTTVGQITPDMAVKLHREQPSHTTHPGVRGFGHDQVITAPAVGSKKRLGIVDVNGATRVAEYHLVLRPEMTRKLDHGRFYLDIVKVFHPGVVQNGCSGDARAKTDVCDPARRRMEHQGKNPDERHRHLIHDIGLWRVDIGGRVRLAVGADDHLCRIAFD